MRRRRKLKHLFDTDNEKRSGVPGTDQPDKPPESSSPGIVDQLREDLGELIDLEKAVAKLELSHKAEELKRDIARYGSAAMLCALGAACLVAAALLLLVTFLPAWLAALLLGSALIGAGALLAMRFRAQGRRVRELPEQNSRPPPSDGVD